MSHLSLGAKDWKNSKIAGIDVLEVRVLEPGERAAIHVKAQDADGGYADEGLPLKVELESSDPKVLRVEPCAVIGGKPGTASVRITAEAGSGEIFEKTLEIKVLPHAESKVRTFASHPRILFTEQERQALKRRIADPERETLGIDVRKVWAELKLKGDKLLQESGFQVTYANTSEVIDVVYPLKQPAPLPDPPGYVDYPFWTMYSRGIEHRLVTLSLMYALTEDIRYADKAKSILLDLAGYHRWYEFPHRGAEGNLSNAHFTLGAAAAYDVLYAVLNDGERRTVRTAILEKGLRPMAIDFGNDDQHNIVVAKQVAMMIGALAIADEEPAALKYIDRTYDYMRTYLDRRVESEETEGLMYNNIAACHLAQAAVALKKTTGDDSLITHRFLTEVVPEQFFYFKAPGNEPVFANLSDSHPRLDLSYMMSLLAENASNGAAMWYVQQYEATKQSVLLNLGKGTEPVPPERYFAGQMSRVFPKIGWAALRSGWGERDHLVAFTSSPSSRGHNHLDQNHFILNVAGEWLVTDPGYQDYRPGPKHDFTDGSVGHNVLLVNGQGQTVRGGGRLMAWHLSPVFDAVRGDAAASYGGALRGWLRTVVHVDASYIVVIDDIALNEPSDRAELLLHTTADIRKKETSGPPFFTFQGERAAVHVRTASSRGAEAETTRYPGAEEYGPYLVFRLKTDADGRARFVTLLVPDPDGAAAVPEWKAEWIGEDAVITVRGRDRIRAAADGALEWIRLPEETAANPEAEPEAYALFAGTVLRAGGRELLSFSHPSSGTVYRDGDAKGTYRVRLTLPAEGTVRLALPEDVEAEEVRNEDGSDLSSLAREGHAVVMTLPAGEHRLKVRIRA